MWCHLFFSPTYKHSIIIIPDICHLFYTRALWGLKIFHSKVHKTTAKLPKEVHLDLVYTQLKIFTLTAGVTNIRYDRHGDLHHFRRAPSTWRAVASEQNFDGNFYLTFTLENWFPNIEIFYFVQTYSGGGDQVLWFLSWGCQWEQKNWPRPWRTDRSDDDHDLDEIKPQKWSIVWFWDFVPISLPDCSECGRSGHPSCLQFTRWMSQ